MNKRYVSLASMMTLCFLLLLISGCGTSGNKEGTDAASVANVGDTACVQCHSANTEALTGQGLIAQYKNSSPHRNSAYANNGNGCEACHGAAAQHQGKGPIAYVNPYDNNGARCADCHKGNYAGNFTTKFASSNHANVTIEEGSNCVRCHTHEGAVLSNIAGVTGDYSVTTNKSYQTVPIPAKGWSQFKCQTCHEHGGALRTVMARYNNPFKADSANGTLVAWDPNNNREQDQFDLCTSCHTMTTNTYGTGVIGSNGREISGSLYMASGTPAHAATGKPPTIKAGYHDTSWYRLIATTHYDNAATGLNATDGALSTGNVIEGYVIRMNKETPCFDCHAHEAN
ncbi:MAG: C-type polyheme cytochrome OmcB, partial [Syntrophus sp. (in: bacteria)]|nr:C-type polyheme cytochrome OmcB [Syntrophus sp. (in: bacteria)]